MYIIIKRDNESKRVLTVETTKTYKNKSEQEILDAIQKYNSENKYGTNYTAIDIKDECLVEAFMFLMGEDKYKRTYRLEDISDRLSNIGDRLYDIDTDIYALKSIVPDIRKEMKDIKEE